MRIYQILKFEWNRRGTESKMREKWGKNQCCRDPSITVLTNQVHLKIQFRHIFDQKCPLTDSLHRLASRFARTSFHSKLFVRYLILSVDDISEPGPFSKCSLNFHGATPFSKPMIVVDGEIITGRDHCLLVSNTCNYKNKYTSK